MLNNNKLQMIKNNTTTITKTLLFVLCCCLQCQHVLSLSASTRKSLKLKTTKSYFATCIPGLEEVLRDELKDIFDYHYRDETSPDKEEQIYIEIQKSGVSFELPKSKNGQAVALRMLLWLRTPHVLMEQICDPGYIEDEHDLYDFVYSNVDVASTMGNGQGDMLTLSSRCVLRGSNSNLPKKLSHSHFSALTVKNAIVDKCRNLREDEARPDVDVNDPDVPFFLSIKGVPQRNSNAKLAAEALLYRTLNGNGSMHRRGYREDMSMHKASMKESMASGLLLIAGWAKLVEASKEDGEPAILVDPMCGSGTFGLEGALIAADVAPGLLRMENTNSTNNKLPPVVRWKANNDDDFDVKECWDALIEEAKERRKVGMAWLQQQHNSNKVQILCNEVNPGAHILGKRCAQKVQLAQILQFSNHDCQDWVRSNDPNLKKMVPGRTMIVTNPPWGLRLDEDSTESWESLKEFLNRECGGMESWVLSGNADLTRILRMKKSRSVPLMIAEEQLRWLQYHVFDAKKKEEYKEVIMEEEIGRQRERQRRNVNDDNVRNGKSSNGSRGGARDGGGRMFRKRQ